MKRIVEAPEENITKYIPVAEAIEGIMLRLKRIGLIIMPPPMPKPDPPIPVNIAAKQSFTVLLGVN